MRLFTLLMYILRLFFEGIFTVLLTYFWVCYFNNIFLCILTKWEKIRELIQTHHLCLYFNQFVHLNNWKMQNYKIYGRFSRIRDLHKGARWKWELWWNSPKNRSNLFRDQFFNASVPTSLMLMRTGTKRRSKCGYQNCRQSLCLYYGLIERNLG